MRWGLALVIIGWLMDPATAAAPERVEIHAGEAVLKAVLFKPAGPGPFPGIVALHGCSGLMTRGELSVRYRDWGERLSGSGFAVLFPDSFGSRGLGSQCRIGNRAIRASRERVADANAARRWLQHQSYIVPDRVSLLGWSNGAVAALWTVRPRAAPKDDTPDFRAAAVLYPSCNRLVDVAWSARIPTLVLIGQSDDWTSASICQQMVTGAHRRSARVSIVTYPGAFHQFDHPNLPLREHTGLAFTADGSGRAHTGTDAAGRADALKRVPEWFAR